MLIITSLCLSLASFSAHASAPRESAADARVQSAPSEECELKQKRVLHLGNGQLVRALTQFVDGQWRLRRNGAWIALDASAVSSWRAEADLLREARRLARTLDPKDIVRRTVYAKWLVTQGLIEEATVELDAILHLAPDADGALCLLKSRSFARPRAGDPATEPKRVAQALINAGLGAGPVQRELLIESLGALQANEASAVLLRQQLLTGLHSANILRRTFSAHALRRLLPGEELYPLMQRCILDISRPVRREAALAVRAAGDPGLILPLVKALGSDSRAVRSNAAESLGQVGHPLAVPALVAHFSNLPQSGGGGVAPTTAHIFLGSQFAFVQDFDLEIAQGSSIADPIVRTLRNGVMLDARVGGISGITFVTEYRTVYSALKTLTGANPGSSPQDWQGWLKEHEQAFVRHE